MDRRPSHAQRQLDLVKLLIDATRDQLPQLPRTLQDTQGGYSRLAGAAGNPVPLRHLPLAVRRAIALSRATTASGLDAVLLTRNS